MFLPALLLAALIQNPTIESITLDNGIQVHLLPIEGSRNISIISIVPYGFTGDAAGRAHWCHLIEHLLTTSTGPIEDYREVNAETMTAAMHLDFMRPSEHWQEGIDKQATWLACPEFEQEDIDREVPRVVSEIENVDRLGNSGKMAIAAWAQAVGFGRADVSINEHLKAVTADALNAYARHRLFADGPPTLVVAGRFERESLVESLKSKIGSLSLPEGKPLEAPADPTRPEKVHWDLQTPFQIIAWPVPEALLERPELLDVAQAIGFLALQQIPAPHRREGGFSFVEAQAEAAGRPYLIALTPLKDASEETLAAAQKHGQEVRARLPKGIPQTRAMAAMQTTMMIQQLLDPKRTIEQSTGQGVDRALVEGNIALQIAFQLWRFPGDLPQKIEALQQLDDDDQKLLIELFDPKTGHELLILPR